MNTEELTDADGELLPEILALLGFKQKRDKLSKEFYWYHPENPMNELYYHILTPDAVKDILIEIGQLQFRQKVLEKIENMEFNEPESSDCED